MTVARAFILEDVAETRGWLREIVSRAFPAVEIHEAGTLRDARGTLRRHPPDLALIDLGLPDGSGLDMLSEVRAATPDCLLVVTTVMGDDASVVAALSAGAEGYLMKDTPDTLMVTQLQQISHGLPALSPAVARRLMGHFRRTGPITAEAVLTQRESEVLALISRGLRNAEVAGSLGIAESTVAGYIKSIYRKLGISSRAEAAWHAAQLGL